MAGAFAYSGSAISAIDDKGRLSIPTTLRKDLVASSDGRTLCLGLHEKWNCLVGFGLSRKADLLAEIDKEWEASLARGVPYDKDTEGTRKFSSIHEMSFDASGRFVLPTDLRSIGGLKNTVLFHGIGSTFCLWDPQALLDATDDVPVDKRLIAFHLEEAKKKK